MLMKFATVLFAISMSIGLAHARMGSSSLTHAHFDTCSEGMVKAMCVCRAGDGSGHHQLCRGGRYCHTFDGVCRQ
jgi:hypothetical protein